MGGGGLTFGPEMVDVNELTVSSVHDLDSLWQMLACEMEDSSNEDGEQCWSDDT